VRVRARPPCLALIHVFGGAQAWFAFVVVVFVYVFQIFRDGVYTVEYPDDAVHEDLNFRTHVIERQ
jgi:hypothetical protein